jgi:quercetin dioxygenase-like cupin family protein
MNNSNQMNNSNEPQQPQPERSQSQISGQDQVKDPNTMEQQDFQPDTGLPEDQEEKQVRRRHSIGTERVKLAEGEATEEA